MPERLDAVVLAGGAARRMGGRDKPSLAVGGRSLLDRVLDALLSCDRVVVVGPPRPTEHQVVAVQEDPPGGGPVTGLAAGLRQTTAPLVAVLAADLPFITSEVVSRLAEAVATTHGLDGAVLLDDRGKDQLLLGVWRSAALAGALAELGADRPLAGASMRRLLAGLSVVRVAWADNSGLPPWQDCDTDEDLRRAEELA